jgi:hypothetical protein
VNLFSRIYAALTQGPPAPVLQRDGHKLWWDWHKWIRLPILLDGSCDASAVNVACQAVNATAQAGLLFAPQPLIPEARNAFYGSRDTYQGAIVIAMYVMTPTPGTWWRCTSDLRYDKRTGEMRNALIEWNVQPGDWRGNQNRLLHELGHCLGLEHCDGTIMQAARSNWSESMGFDRAQVAYLKGLRR